MKHAQQWLDQRAHLQGGVGGISVTLSAEQATGSCQSRPQRLQHRPRCQANSASQQETHGRPPPAPLAHGPPPASHLAMYARPSPRASAQSLCLPTPHTAA